MRAFFIELEEARFFGKRSHPLNGDLRRSEVPTPGPSVISLCNQAAAYHLLPTSRGLLNR